MKPTDPTPGTLPPTAEIQRLVTDTHAQFRGDDRGEVSDLYPTLAAADPAWFGLSFATSDGQRCSAGDSTIPFVLMSVAKPFTFALVCDTIGLEEAGARLGLNATGMPFNSLEAVERNRGRTNPMVNPGAIATVGLLGEDAWPLLRDNLSRFAGRQLQLDEDTFAVVSATNVGNRALTYLLATFDTFERDPLTVLEAYTRQCCVSVNSEDLALMGATLANGGVNPATGERVVSAEACRAALAVMTTAGLYETSGDWLYKVQLPGKSGVSGGIVGVSPGKGAFASYSPRIDAAANSVRGQLAAERLSRALSLGVLGG